MCTKLWILGAPGIFAITTWGTGKGKGNGIEDCDIVGVGKDGGGE